jgi:GDPmannose 4,6-dehydratase
MEFVTRKITHTVAQIVAGKTEELRLGNLDSQRDWGFADDYVRAMWMMLQQDDPSEYVIGTGQLHTVRDFCQVAFETVGLNYKDYVVQDPQFYRPVEEHPLVANPTYARVKLGWEPKISFNELVRIMVKADLRALGITT